MNEQYPLSMDNFLAAVADEVNRARAKFPHPGGAMCALTEEVGELAKALLQESASNVYKEAVQVATMALRVATEGDPSLNGYRVQRGQNEYPDITQMHVVVLKNISISVGSIIRYGQGTTALMRVTSIYKEQRGHRFYGEQYYGGAVGASSDDCMPPTAIDLEQWSLRNIKKVQK